MKSTTHMIGGIAAAVGAKYAFHLDLNAVNDAYLGASAIFGALIPDICHPQSKIGRRLKILSVLINGTFGHRTITHSIWFCLGAAFLLTVHSIPQAIALGISVGVISHLFLDALTDQGIQFFWPFHVRVRCPIHTTTGSIGEWICAGALICFIVAYGGNYI